MADSALERSALDPETLKAYKEVLNNSGLLKSAKVDFNDPGILKGLKTTPVPLALDTTTGDDFHKANRLYLSSLARSLNKLSENELIALSLKSAGDDGAPLPVDGKWSPALATRLKLTMNTLEKLDEETIKNTIATGTGHEPTLADKFKFSGGAGQIPFLPLLSFLPLQALRQSVSELLDMATGDSAEEKTAATIANFNKSKEIFVKRFTPEHLQLAVQVNLGMDSPDTGNVIKDMAALLHKYNYLSNPNIDDPYNKDFLDAYFKIIPNNTHLPNIGDGLADLTKKLPPLVLIRMELKHKFPDERVPAVQDIETFKLKNLTNDIAESGVFPDTKGFDITETPYHPLENGFLNSLAQIYISSNMLGLKEEEIEKLADLPEARRKQVEARIKLDTALHNYATKYPETGKDIQEALKLRMRALVEQPDISTQPKADGTAPMTSTGNERAPMAATEDETPSAILPDDDEALSSLALQAAALYPISFAAKILRTQYSFGDHGSTLNDVIYDLNTQQKVADFIGDTFQRYTQSEDKNGLKNSDGETVQYFDVKKDGKVQSYEIVLHSDKGNYGHIYEITAEKKRANRVANLTDKESLFAQAQDPHGAVLAMMDAYGDKHVTPAADKEAERARLTQSIIQRSGHPDIADELQQKLRSKSLEEFKQGDLYRKLKSGYGDDSDFDSHIIALWNLENFYQSSASGNEISPDYIEQYKSVYGLLDFMLAGEDYNPDQHKKFRNSLNVEIGLLAHKDAYAILRMRGAVDPRLVYGEGNVPETYKDKPMSKEDVAQYVRNKMEDRAAELGIPIDKISEAMMGLYKNTDGKTIHFMQNLEDQRLVFETLKKPPIDDHAVWQKIGYLANSNTLPPLDFLVNRMTDDQAKNILGISREALISGYDDNGKRLQDFDRRELTGKLMAGSILHDERNTNIRDAVMNYYESYMGRHANHRAPEWNTLYGQPDNLPLWAYMRVNWASLEKEYDGLLGDGRDHDYTQTLDDVREKLASRPELLYKLESELEAYKDYDIVRFNELESYRHGSYGERRDLYIRQQEDMQLQVTRAASAMPAAVPST